MTSSGRFVSPELLDLGPPPALATVPQSELLASTTAKLVFEMAAIGIAYDVATLPSDPRFIDAQLATYRDYQRRVEIDAAVTQTYLGSAEAAHLDRRAADYGVLRRVWLVADPVSGAAAVSESDESLKTRARLAWEAQSTAGPVGAYVFHALDAHPEILDATVYGPESGHVQPGEVLVLLLARGESGIPTNGQVDAVAAHLDAFHVTYANGTTSGRQVRDEQSVRPLGARVMISAPQPSAFAIDATLYVAAGTDPVAIEATARSRLANYLDSRRRIGGEIPRSGLYAALHMVGPAGIPIIDEVSLAEPSADVEPAFDRLATASSININVVTR